LGFIMKEDTTLRRCYISSITSKSTAATYQRWFSTLIGAFILAVDDVIVFGLDDTNAALSRALVDSSTTSDPTFVTITFAHDRAITRPNHDPDPDVTSPIQMDQICHVSQIYETGEAIKYQPRLDIEWFKYFEDLTKDVVCDDGSTEIRLVSENISHTKTFESLHKTSTSQFTRRHLQQRDDFPEWLAAEFKQLDTHASDGMFGEPCPRPKGAIVLRSIWTYILKKDGTKKARNCGDGRPLRDDKFRRLESVYTACVSQAGVKIFFATAAILNYVIYDLDAINAFGQAGELFEMVYMEVDKQYKDWYMARKKRSIPDGWVLPVKGSIQGHPDSGEVWQSRINEVIHSYGFRSTTHEPCLYCGEFKGHDMLICRQVDDMLMAGDDAKIIQEFAQEIAKHLKDTSSTKPSYSIQWFGYYTN
jgi:Reverse transcriptase (RNA-dependent DNA polymerase).